MKKPPQQFKKVVAFSAKVWYVLVLQKSEEVTPTMCDYMRALHLRFKTPSQQATELERKVNVLHRQLASCLTKPDRRILLRLVDLEDALRNQSNLDSFMSGFRLASGIQRELMEQPPYSFDTEEERRAREAITREEG